MIWIALFGIVVGLACLSVKIDQIENRFFRKHESDVRYRDRETEARAGSVTKLRQRIHKLECHIKKSVGKKVS